MVLQDLKKTQTIFIFNQIQHTIQQKFNNIHLILGTADPDFAAFTFVVVGAFFIALLTKMKNRGIIRPAGGAG